MSSALLFVRVRMCRGRIRSRRKGIQSRNLLILTVAGEPLCLVDARRQRREGKHVCVCDPLARILLLQIRSFLLIIVIDPP